MCKSIRSVKTVSTDNEDVRNVEDRLEELFIDVISINAIDVKQDWLQYVKLIDYENKKLTFKIDKGAQFAI